MTFDFIESFSNFSIHVKTNQFVSKDDKVIDTNQLSCDILIKPVIRASVQLPPDLIVSGKFILSGGHSESQDCRRRWATNCM